LLAGFLLAPICALAADTSERGFKPLFNGHDLTGWAGQSEYWSVQEGAITGTTTKEHSAKSSTFLVAKVAATNLLVDDFELRFSYRIVANNPSGSANSGVLYRGRDLVNFAVAGYQADLDAGGASSGNLYDEAAGGRGRGLMARSGDLITWTSDGKKKVTGS